jgi:hypothetical protein
MIVDDDTVRSAELPIACLLPDENIRQRRDTILEPLFNRQQEVRPLADGYAVRFPADNDTSARLLQFITEERACCPFFIFELIFEPAGGPIWLHLRGPDGTKEFVATMPAGNTFVP